MKITYLSTVTAALLCFSHVYAAELLVIVHKSNDITSLTASEVSNIFLDKTNAFPNSTSAKPLDQDESDTDRDYFYSNVVGKSPVQIQKYWARQLFSGNATPPDNFGDDADIVKNVSEQPNAIGYINADTELTDDVKIVLEVK